VLPCLTYKHQAYRPASLSTNAAFSHLHRCTLGCTGRGNWTTASGCLRRPDNYGNLFFCSRSPLTFFASIAHVLLDLFDSKQLNYLFAHVVALELEIHLTRQISTLAGKNTISDPEVVSLEDIGNDFMALITLMGMKSGANEWTVWSVLSSLHTQTHARF
jgi:hypothetical protein